MYPASVGLGWGVVLYILLAVGLGWGVALTTHPI